MIPNNPINATKSQILPTTNHLPLPSELFLSTHSWTFFPPAISKNVLTLTANVHTVVARSADLNIIPSNMQYGPGTTVSSIRNFVPKRSAILSSQSIFSLTSCKSTANEEFDKPDKSLWVNDRGSMRSWGRRPSGIKELSDSTVWQINEKRGGCQEWHKGDHDESLTVSVLHADNVPSRPCGQPWVRLTSMLLACWLFFV